MDPFCGSGGLLVLPDDYNPPAQLRQANVRVLVTGLVGLELGLPPRCVRLRGSPVYRASMPEARVNEHCDPRPGEHDVDLSSRTGEEPLVQSVPEPTRMELTPKLHLSAGVAPALTLHP